VAVVAQQQAALGRVARLDVMSDRAGSAAALAVTEGASDQGLAEASLRARIAI
jgi:hypothetical protein